MNIPLAFVLPWFTGIPAVKMYILVGCVNLIKAAIGFRLVRSRKWVNNLVENH